MLRKITNKITTVLVLQSFLLSSLFPANGYGKSIDGLIEKDAIFGWCGINRINKKTTHLAESIKKYKEGKKTVEEVTYEIASLKKTASKTFKKNYKVRKIMQMANRKIEEYLCSLMGEESEGKKARLLETDDMQNQYESIGLFLSDLQDYEDSEDSEDYEEAEYLPGEDFSFLKKMQDGSYIGRNYSKDDEKPEAKILFAYVSIFCGCLLCMIPTPITRNVGASMISGGFYVLSEEAWDQQDKINKKRNVRSFSK